MAPELFALTNDERAMLLREPGEEDAAAVELAARACPRQAIHAPVLEVARGPAGRGRTTVADIDLISGDVFARGQPHEQWRRLRSEAPVSWHDGNGRVPGFWAVCRYRDVVAVSSAPEAFSSRHGIQIASDPKRPQPSAGGGLNVMTTDPPRHGKLRRTVNRRFSARSVAVLTPFLHDLTRRLVGAAVDRGRGDFVDAVAAQIPLAVICDMLGVPAEQHGRILDLSNLVVGGDDPEYRSGRPDRDATANDGQRQLFLEFSRYLSERRHARRQDLMSALLDADIDGQPLTDQETLYMCYVLAAAGNETTRNAISGGLLALIENPDQRDRLVADRSLIPSAVEEILRFVSPVMHMARTATRDVELDGQLIREGEKVVMWYASANRDEAVFADPDRFDVTRTPNDHLAFGYGEHFCLGAALARLEMQVTFEVLLDHLPRLSLDGPVERLRSNFLGGIKRMPVTWQ